VDVQLRPILVLIAANLVPLIGAMFFGWSLFEIVVIYWLENAVIGFYNVLKMAMARGGDGAVLARLGTMTFFSFHYGLFWVVHGVFVFQFFAGDTFGVSLDRTGLSPGNVLIALGSLILSHGVSFVLNFVGGGERMDATVAELMAQPYSRVVILHLTILGGGFAAMLLGSPLWAVVMMIVLKIGVDVAAHRAEHRKLASTGSTAA
jgi:hypothetical protein